MPEVSIVMINRNGAQTIPTALQTLRESMLQAPTHDAEIIVVDNNSTDDSVRVIKAGLRGFGGSARLIEEGQPGVNAARNAGIRASVGKVVMFVDSDVTFSTGWLRAYLEAINSHPDVAVFAGRIVPSGLPSSVPEWLDVAGPFCRTNIIVALDLGDTPTIGPLSAALGPVGPNMAFRRTVFENYGLFDTRFGLRPGSLIAGAEAEFVDRLQSAGLIFMYVPESTVLHPVRPDQLTQKYFLRRLHGIGRVLSRIRRLRRLPAKRIMGMTLFVLPELAGSIARYAKAIPRGNAKELFFFRGNISVLLGHLHEDFVSRHDSDALDTSVE